MKYDVLIIGAGPGGITAAIKLKEANKNVAIIEASMPGGKVNIAPRVDNYPGFSKISGPDLAFDFFMKMNAAHVEMISTKVNKLSKDNDTFIIETNKGNYEASEVILASGTDEKKLGLPNELELLGHGLSYCAVCDGHFFKNQVVAVVAEDKYAINEAIYLAAICKEVIVITSKDKLKGDKRSLDELNTFSNVKYIYNKEIKELKGNPLNSVILNDHSELFIRGIFPLLGYIPNTQYLDKSLLDEDGFVKVDKNYHTNIPHLYAIGDVISRELKQIYLATMDATKVVTNILNNK
ncbi:MAG: FAD-dependent oxidoreductase [Bacilli bacterium]|nr:FAD-dependent oxidoreductase [Bacilli bacterium]